MSTSEEVELTNLKIDEVTTGASLSTGMSPTTESMSPTTEKHDAVKS